MPELLLELFSEEIPARMQQQAAESFAQALVKKFSDEGLAEVKPESYVTPRRLTIHIAVLPKKVESKTTEKRGPRTNAPQQAIDGFLKSTGLRLDQLEKRGEFYFAVAKEGGKDTLQALPKILESVIESFTWPKSMRWSDHHITWVRPLKNILCLFDSHVVPVKFGHLTANNTSYGHRFLGPDPFKVNSFNDYQDKLHSASVILSAEKRQSVIMQAAEAEVKKKKLTVKPDDRLLVEVAGLVEWPEILIGNIDSQYMALPPEVLSTSMRAHQKYFSLLQSDGKLAPHFLLVSNMKASDKGKSIIAGNERVLRARLSDAKFFWEQDTKKTLESRVEKLGNVTYHTKLGSYLDKTRRMVEMAKFLSPLVPGTNVKSAGRAAYLAKADLFSEMVGEFPELQGIMGGYYAAQGKEEKEVALAIREHYYYPVTYNNDGKLTQNPLSLVVALADKMDSLVGLFAAGEAPTGSKDPYALRRAALSTIGMVIENKLRISVQTLINDALSLYPAALQNKGIIKQIAEFFADRLKVKLKELGVRHDMIDAVFDGGKDDDMYRLNLRAIALDNFLKTQHGGNLLTAYKRAANIVAAEEKKDNTSYAGKVQENLLQSAEEKELFKVFSSQKSAIETAIKEEKYGNAMAELAKLREPVDKFFDKVIVNDKDANIRKNRLYMLSELKGIMDRIANFSKVEG